MNKRIRKKKNKQFAQHLARVVKYGMICTHAMMQLTAVMNKIRFQKFAQKIADALSVIPPTSST